MSFTFHLPTRIHFGQPAIAALNAELVALAARRVLLVSDPGLAQMGLVQAVAAGLDAEVAIFTRVSSNPTTAEVEEGLALAQDMQAAALVALGGGSAIDVAKAIAMLAANGGAYADYQWGGRAITRPSLPLLAVPTTAGTGSEVSRVAVIVDPQRPFKKGVLSPHMFPHAAVIDPELTCSMPPWLTAATGMDAFIHALEAYVGRRAHPFTDQLALATLETAWWALPRAVANGADMEARQAMMLAALWGGIAMDHAGLGLIHALSGPLTGHLHLHHGLANALILPYVLRFNLPAIPEARLVSLRRVFGLPPGEEVGEEVRLLGEVELLAARLTRFVRDLGLPTHLSELESFAALQDASPGVDWDAIAAETTRMALIQNNPRPASETDCLQLLQEMGAG